MPGLQNIFFGHVSHELICTRDNWCPNISNQPETTHATSIANFESIFRNLFDKFNIFLFCGKFLHAFSIAKEISLVIGLRFLIEIFSQRKLKIFLKKFAKKNKKICQDFLQEDGKKT